jgi:hypothetical protein
MIKTRESFKRSELKLWLLDGMNLDWMEPVRGLGNGFGIGLGISKKT